MIQPRELKLDLPVRLSNGVMSTTIKVWDMLNASHIGDLEMVKKISRDCPELLFAQYNYTPPIYFAVREGHTELVKFLLANGAHDPSYRTYPFQDSLQTLANDRGHFEIEKLLNDYAADTSLHKYKGDNGEIIYSRSELENNFQKAVYDEDLGKTETLLNEHPELAKDETFFWSEGILTFAAKTNNRPMIDLLMNYGATVPSVLKWGQFYYFEHNEGSGYMMEKGMNPNTMSWHCVTLLHDMAQKGNIAKAGLLINYGADPNAVDDEYQSTPLGMATRWGQIEMVNYLLKHGADPNKSGAPWATPLAWAKKKGFTEIQNILSNAGAR